MLQDKFTNQQTRVSSIEKNVQDLCTGRKNLEDFSVSQKEDIYNFLVVELVHQEVKRNNEKNQQFYNKIKDFRNMCELGDLLSQKDKLAIMKYATCKIKK